MLSAMRITGLAMLALIWLSPVAALTTGSIIVHMGVHLTLVALAPALLAPRLPLRPGPAGLFAVLAVEMALVWAWHAPAAHLWARLDRTGFVLEQASFLGAGLLVWAAARSAGRFGGACVLFGTVMHMTLLGALIGLAPRPLYGEICAGWFGLGPLQEQQVAGALMAVGGGAIYLAAALVRLAPGLTLPEPAR
ncbi:putative membrane protein [Lutimaribacter pacificus]|uniref:Putative membrane protein n=1 Tax=Lutimaribacter pacificus TaxID=391948 RepID=A0A1H0M6M9_9RHOB|nr:cytochrome c oxidase assembly protein [Lutimaribacter pacificus]SDO75866.1 putative membrane protein [Lutimaribacter pacificus]SHK78172.1 putative membrane protein [Lutimaribacter pacificus]